MTSKLCKAYDESRSHFPEDEKVTEVEGILYSSSGLVTVPDVGSFIPTKCMSLDRIKRLVSIGFEWNGHKRRVSEIKKCKKMRERIWNDMYGKLCSYRHKHGNCYIPNKYAKDQKLAYWVIRQRNELNKLCKAYDESRSQFPEDEEVTEVEGILYSSSGLVTVPDVGSLFPTKYMSLDRIKRLVSIGFEWSGQIYEKRWNDMYERICRYKREHGHCHVPRQYAKDQKLASWVQLQRYELKKLCKAYEASPSSTSQPPEHENVIEKEGVLCSSSGVVTVPDVGSLFPTKCMSLDRIKRLVSIGFEWNGHKRRVSEIKKCTDNKKRLNDKCERIWNDMQ
uniref:Helicase-associated domain-containing protein n=1 Tax=Ditylum brightwellii TaxID=49249 RepID=A0A7S4RB56_9STRA